MTIKELLKFLEKRFGKPNESSNDFIIIFKQTYKEKEIIITVSNMSLTVVLTDKFLESNERFDFYNSSENRNTFLNTIDMLTSKCNSDME